MKKINKKGVTIAELVVSFALVSVAVVYFYQTLSTVSELYATSRTETQEFVDKTYALRIADEVHKLSRETLKYFCSSNYDPSNSNCRYGLNYISNIDNLETYFENNGIELVGINKVDITVNGNINPRFEYKIKINSGKTYSSYYYYDLTNP